MGNFDLGVGRMPVSGPCPPLRSAGRLIRISPWFLFAIAALLAFAAVAPAASADNYTLPYGYPYESYPMTTAYSSDSLEGWSASDVINGGVYSSASFPSSANTRGTSIAVWMDAPHPVNELVLTARVLNGQILAFPQSYSIYLTSADNTSWNLIANVSIQPDVNGNLLIALSRTYTTSGVMILPTELSVDNYNVYYFQLAGVSLGYAPVSNGVSRGRLSCWIPGISNSLPTNSVTLSGSNVSSTVGVTSQLGGIGTYFSLIYNGTEINILSPFSVGGGGWSTTYYTVDAAGTAWSFNQSAGNSDQMWGYTALLGGPQGLWQINWNPLYSDHWQPNENYTGPSTGTTPCDASTNAIINDDGKLKLSGSIVAVGPGTKLVNWVNEYSYRARQNESFGAVDAEQALYLDQNTALQNNLRIYLVGESRDWSGEITPLVFTPSNFNLRQIEGQGGCNSATAPNASCWMHTANMKYAMLVYNVGGVDIGIAIHRINALGQTVPMQAQINMSCDGNGVCGAIDFHTWLDFNSFKPSPGNFTVGQIRSYSVAYDIGTLQELQMNGYSK